MVLLFLLLFKSKLKNSQLHTFPLMFLQCFQTKTVFVLVPLTVHFLVLESQPALTFRRELPLDRTCLSPKAASVYLSLPLCLPLSLVYLL